jgi:AcrR family transcriptional regulator
MYPSRQAPSDRPVVDRLLAGSNGVGHERVSGIQRSRILAATVEVVGEHGAASVTVAHIVARSGVSRRTFYELFVDREDCFLAAFDDAIRRMGAVVVPAYEVPARWHERMRAGLIALLGLLDDEWGVGRLVIVDALGAGPNALERRGRVLERVIAAVDEGCGAARRGGSPPPMAAEGVVGGVLAVLHSRLLAFPPVVQGPGTGLPQSSPVRIPSPSFSSYAEEGSLVGLTGPLMSMIVLPYLGPAAARKELARPVPERHVRQRMAPADPLRDLDMRLTYRTVRVLMAVAELGGQGSYPSNREVGLAAGMTDQGQTSKLLSRLHRLGLIENTGNGPTKGAPNAWTLTPKGTNIQQALGHQSTARSAH